MVSLGNRIKQLRRERGMTQEDLAEKINVARTTVSRYELGEIEPKIQNLIAIAMAFDVSTDYLLGIRKADVVNPARLSEEAVKALSSFIAAVIRSAEGEREE